MPLRNEQPWWIFYREGHWGENDIQASDRRDWFFHTLPTKWCLCHQNNVDPWYFDWSTRSWNILNGCKWANYFNYAEPCSRHNRTKHWVDDHYSRRHDPIDIAEKWRTKWWPNWQFSSFLSLSEVNDSVSCAFARGASQEPQLEFQQKFALALMKNTLNEECEVMVDSSPATRRSMAQWINVEHNLVTKDLHCSTWKKGKRNKVKDCPKQSKICYKAMV